MVRKILVLLAIGICTFFNTSALDIDGKWQGTFIEYIHNTYDVQMMMKVLPFNTFHANLKITNGQYFGEYNVSGNICSNRSLEITAIFLIRENSANNWIDCLNGVWDLNEDENELTFTDTWLNQNSKKDVCKVKFANKDMFQCLRSAYFRRSTLYDFNPDFDTLWAQYTNKNKKQIIDETLLAKKEDKSTPTLDTLTRINDREINVKESIEVSGDSVIIEYWDRFNEDGDSITLYLNNKPIVYKKLLTKVKQSLTVKLTQKTNYLVLHAENLGKEPPNTATIAIKDGKKIQTISLNSTLRTSSAIKLVVKDKK